ncbi:RNA-directed DNA polymerase, eukaryota, reverse transcriptase zinc-binding domain protein [Tanacetum coccineum]
MSPFMLVSQILCKVNVLRDYGVQDFKDCVESLDMEDISMTGTFFIWIQKMKNPNLGILKKLDRIMGNCHFLEEFRALLKIDEEAYEEIEQRRERERWCAQCFVIVLAMLDKERFLRQKYKIEWLKEGDHNNAYFYNSIKGRMSKAMVETIVEGETYLVDDPIGLFSKKISDIEALEMVKPVSNEDIKSVIFYIEDSKAPGPDTFTSKFFKASWGIIGGDVCKAVKEFFSSGKMLGELNTTIISIVPKSKNPRKAFDYRLIACYNVVYKCISKVIANRLKDIFSRLIDPNQGAFIGGRQISDNILLI